MQAVNESFSNVSQISFYDSHNQNTEFHYSVHETSVLYKTKKNRKLMKPHIDNPGPCLCFTTSQHKSPSFFSKISSIFCCYIPDKKKKNQDSNILSSKPFINQNFDSPKTLGSLENPTGIQNSSRGSNETSSKKAIIFDYAEKNDKKILASEINMLIPPKKEKCLDVEIDINKAQPKEKYLPRNFTKPCSGSIQGRSPFLKRNYVSTKLCEFPENTLFFLKNNENNLVIAKLKISDFFTDATEQTVSAEYDDIKYPKLSLNSLFFDKKKIKFDNHLSSFDHNKAPKKYSFINLSDEIQTSEKKENRTYDERIRSSKPKSQIFSKISPTINYFEKKMKIDSESWEFMIPDKISSYIAKRCRSNAFGIVLDAFCGIGLNAIQFHKEDFQVIAMDSRKKAVDYAHYNSSMHRINEGINFIKGDFLEVNLNKIMPDVILINPVLNWSPEKKFSLLKNGCFDYQQVLLKALRTIKNVILCLPKYVEISEIVELFAECFKEIDEIDENSIEIEYIFINKELQQILHFSLALDLPSYLFYPLFLIIHF